MKKNGFTAVEAIIVIVAIAGLLFWAFAGSPMAEIDRENTSVQRDVMSRALAAHPNPDVDRFLTRENVVKWMERMDTPGRIFYIYIMNWDGEVTHYFVAQYRPVSIATFLTNPVQTRRYGSSGTVTVPAPALDGTYYGSGGASDQFFFFDAQTDAYIELKGLNYFVADQPLALDVPRFAFASEEAE